MAYKRIFIVVADSLGVGAQHDSDQYNDKGADTLGHILEHYPNLPLPILDRLGIMNLKQEWSEPYGIVTRLAERSVGKDTLTGHFELMGLLVENPFPSFTETGFPPELISMLETFSGRKMIGNISASGTEIIKELGERQIETGELIIYTSADSVLQIAANEEVIPLDELYRVCEYARKVTLENPKWQVGRIIARPFIGKTKETFTRTTNRHDYALKPFGKTALDYLKESGFATIAVGKINDIFDGQGITKSYRTTSNHMGMEITTHLLADDFTGIVFTNLVDFDALYGHRRDVFGYAMALTEFDRDLGDFIVNMNDDDLLMVVADHGNDPAHHGTDHTREYVPLIIYSNNLKGCILPERNSFADVAKTVLKNFDIENDLIGEIIPGIVDQEV